MRQGVGKFLFKKKLQNLHEICLMGHMDQGDHVTHEIGLMGHMDHVDHVTHEIREWVNFFEKLSP